MPGTDATICCTGGEDGLTTGCGLAGDGSAGAPLAAAPAAGEEAWPWSCAAADASTLRCDPDTGQLHTPPEHNFWTDSAPPFEHFPAGFGPLSVGTHTGPPGLTTFLGTGPGVGTCRQWAGTATISVFVDVTYTAEAEFRIGFNVENPAGSPAELASMTGILDTDGAGREVFTGSFVRGSGLQPPGTTVVVAYQPVIEVLAGTVTVNSWISERSRAFGTLSTPV